jgi:hypothetical protein
LCSQVSAPVQATAPRSRSSRSRHLIRRITVHCTADPQHNSNCVHCIVADTMTWLDLCNRPVRAPHTHTHTSAQHHRHDARLTGTFAIPIQYAALASRDIRLSRAHTHDLSRRTPPRAYLSHHTHRARTHRLAGLQIQLQCYS